jgi:gas vesicle protein
MQIKKRGRPASKEKVEQITIYLKPTSINILGGKDKIRNNLNDFLNHQLKYHSDNIQQLSRIFS